MSSPAVKVARSTLSWTVRILAQIVFCYLLMYFWIATSEIRMHYTDAPGVYVFYSFCALAVALLFFRRRKDPATRKHRYFWFWLAALIISMPFALLELTLGTNDIEPIILFFRDNGVKEIVAIGKGSFQDKAEIYGFFFIALVACAYFLHRQLSGFRYVLAGAGLVYLLFNPFVHYLYRQVMPNPVLASFDISNYFVEPKYTAVPTEKKNIVIVYLESLELTYENLPSTAKEFAKIRPFADTAIEATNIAQTAGSTYTIAGIVSSQCGVPLLPRAFNNAIYGRKNAGMEIGDFMPRIHCLSDRLLRDGYNMSYMNGADARKYSKKSFLTSHGYSRIFDELSLQDSEKQGFENTWGLNDELLYTHLRKEVDYLAAQDKPFLLSYLTIATHGPDAFLDSDCKGPPEGKSKIPAAIGCSLEKVKDFYQYLVDQGLADKTIFVVMSDHLARKNTVFDELRPVASERRNLFFVKDGERALKIDKLGSPIDIYPTLLELMGYEIEGRRANMGVSLLSDDMSLVQTFGSAKDVNARFINNHKLGEFLWRDGN